ncbi:hypothetical protein [Streptomyces sp. NPDC008125]|uniref:hypothetical protein n=1 Tax=Streptomyces sp. NPDC008125 TaxID=3364811 RepID=UPI0036E4A8E0
MKIDSEDNRASTRRRWGVPLAVAAGVATMSVTAVVVFGGTGEAKPTLASPGSSAGNPTGPAASPRTSTAPGTSSGGTSSGSATSGGTASGVTASGTSPATPATATVTSATTTPIDAGTVAKILASCLGSDASQYEAVLAVRTPLATEDTDGVVVAVNSADQYVQCQSDGDKGISVDSPPTFINNRLWGTGRLIEYFDSFGQSAGKQSGEYRYTVLGAGHYAADVAKVTISYDDDPKEYPAAMAGGAFVYAAAFSTGTSKPDRHFAGPDATVHAYDASGKEIYDQAKDPQFSDQQ